jgi:hypothetical protein
LAEKIKLPDKIRQLAHLAASEPPFMNNGSTAGGIFKLAKFFASLLVCLYYFYFL